MCFCLLGYPSSIYFSLANSLRTSTDTMFFALKLFYWGNLSRPSLVHWPDLKRKSKYCASVIPSRRSEGFSIANLSFTFRAFPPCSKAKRRKFSPRLDDDTLRSVRSRIRGFCIDHARQTSILELIILVGDLHVHCRGLSSAKSCLIGDPISPVYHTIPLFY